MSFLSSFQEGAILKELTHCHEKYNFQINVCLLLQIPIALPSIDFFLSSFISICHEFAEGTVGCSVTANVQSKKKNTVKIPAQL